jgi:hippurate hydrolase
MSNFVIPEIKAAEEEMIAIRHYLHAHPELSLEEFNTSELVAEKLAEWGYAVTRELGKTGLVGSLTKGHSSRTIGLRADMDALPIFETTELPWASTVPGKCTPAATTVTPLFCWRRQNILPRRPASLTARCM